ncbi:MAG: HlyC/CorC family transporter [Sutterella wadsworthensis]|nr:HlyC/CorC family transporter [Sutterella wadsworthensis]
MLTQVVIITLLIIAAAYFAMSEIALAGSRSVRLTRMAEDGDSRAQLVLKLKDNPGYFFSVVQVGINAVAILGGVVGEEAFTGFFAALLAYVLPAELVNGMAFLCSFLFVTVLFVMFADLIPKRVAMSCPEAVAVRCIRPMMVLIMVLKPLVWLLTAMSNGIMRMMSVPLNNEDRITNEDVMATVEAGAKAGVVAPLEHTAIKNMMELEDHLVPSAMTNRDSIIYFMIDESEDSIREKISQTPHNKFLVCDGDIDHVVGHVDGKQLLKIYADKDSLELTQAGLVQPVITIPDSLTLTETLDLFKQESQDFAVVINEYGLTVGIITLKDILWPVMGNYDVWADDQLLVKRSDGSWLVDGSTPVDDIEREFGIESMPEEETYETVAGFIMYMLRRVPKRGDHVDYAGYRFEVTNMDGFHIDQVLMYRPDHRHTEKKKGDKHDKCDKCADKGTDQCTDKCAVKTGDKPADVAVDPNRQA